MSVTINDGQLAATFDQTTEPISLRSPDGRFLGTFLPRLPNEPDIDFAEIEREIADPNTKWHTAEEVMARLQELKCSR